jgi:hypothetical protein
MVDDCDKFYLVPGGELCDAIAWKHGITPGQIIRWNPSVGPDCKGIWASVYLCVSVIGHDSQPPNSVQTPQPTLPGMVRNCDSFVQVKSGDRCDTISEDNGLTEEELHKWNPQLGGKCEGLLYGFYVCISVIGHDPTPTLPPNGIVTPRPHQEKMVKNCNKFHLVENGQTCPAIIGIYKITLAQLIRWNPDAGSACTGLWAGNYACVGVLKEDVCH